VETDFQQIAVPETLLKKRRTTEASREAKLAAAAEAKKVSLVPVTIADERSALEFFAFFFNSTPPHQ
jgi:hypothetical protein